jgi:hypothetical protein
VRERFLVAGSIAASLALVVTSLALGGASYEPASVKDPCQPREWRSPSGIDEIAQQITLSALDGAACTLHVSRETLVLALGTTEGRQRFIDNPRLAAALRSGLVRAIDDAERAGAIPGVVATSLRAVAQQLPTEEVVSAVRDASTLLNNATSLFGQLQGFLNGL